MIAEVEYEKIKTYCGIAVAFALIATLAIPISATELPFTDVPESHLMYDAIKYLYENGIVNGATETTFNPNGTLMRAMIVAMLYRLAGEPGYTSTEQFADVNEDDFFYDAVCWAAELGITTGTTTTTFEPYRLVTIQEVLIMLNRYSEHSECGNKTSLFIDHTRMTRRIGAEGYNYTIAPVAYKAVNWAVNCGILSDYLTYFDGSVVATRALTADYFYRMICLVLLDGRTISMEEFAWDDCPEYIAEKMTDFGSEASVIEELYPIAIEHAFYTADTIYISCHGTTDGTALVSHKNCDEVLHYTDIDSGYMSNAELVYLSACFAGGTFGETLCYVGGADTVIAPIVALEYIYSTSTAGYDGIDYFDARCWEYIEAGYAYSYALDRALEDTWEEFDETFGAENYVIIE